MNIETVNELIASLESAGELSIRETKVMALAKAYQQLAAENVALKESRNNLAEFIHEELDADYPLNMNLETHATDRIIAGIKADGVALVKSAFEMHIQSASCYQDEIVGMESALSIACQVESQLREGADK
ncbi:hypothetical protein ACOIES_10265 [Klebsiella pneumoniae]|uniref:hypothetical protein n=1 Tax=Klebsiella pneumoniae TaxID=573 RepID=UPI003B5CEBA6